MSTNEEVRGSGPISNIEANAHFSAAPRVEVARTSSGKHSWRLSVVADGNSPEALRAARDLAIEIATDLDSRWLT